MKKKPNYRRFLLYLVRWQLSTPVLAVFVWLLGDISPTLSAIIANLIGGAIFYWVDKMLFKDNKDNND